MACWPSHTNVDIAFVHRSRLCFVQVSSSLSGISQVWEYLVQFQGRIIFMSMYNEFFGVDVLLVSIPGLKMWRLERFGAAEKPSL